MIEIALVEDNPNDRDNLIKAYSYNTFFYRRRVYS